MTVFATHTNLKMKQLLACLFACCSRETHTHAHTHTQDSRSLAHQSCKKLKYHPGTMWSAQFKSAKEVSLGMYLFYIFIGIIIYFRHLIQLLTSGRKAGLVDGPVAVSLVAVSVAILTLQVLFLSMLLLLLLLMQYSSLLLLLLLLQYFTDVTTMINLLLTIEFTEIRDTYCSIVLYC